MNRNIGRKLKTLCVLAAAQLVFSFIHTAHSDALQVQPSDMEAIFILKQKCPSATAKRSRWPASIYARARHLEGRR